MSSRLWDIRHDILTLPGHSVLEIGCGREPSLSRFLHDNGRAVTTVDLCLPPDVPWTHIQGPAMDVAMAPHDIIVASHVLEHIQDTGAFLAKVRALLSTGGWFVCAVPPMKPQVVGGHVHLFNLGLLMYNLILSGFDCRHGRFRVRGYNIIAVVQPAVPPPPTDALRHDNGDIELLADCFPVPVRQGFDGNLRGDINWRFG